MENDFFGENGYRMYPMILIQEHFIEITYGNYFGVADLGCNIKVPLKEYECVISDYDFIAVKEFDNDEWQLFEVCNNQIVELIYEEIIYREDEFLLVKIDGWWEVYNLKDYTEEECCEDFADYDE